MCTREDILIHYLGTSFSDDVMIHSNTSKISTIQNIFRQIFTFIFQLEKSSWGLN